VKSRKGWGFEGIGSWDQINGKVINQQEGCGEHTWKLKNEIRREGGSGGKWSRCGVSRQRDETDGGAKEPGKSGITDWLKRGEKKPK